MRDLSVSIIIPVLNEADRIGDLLKHLPDNIETICVDGGSMDSTVEIAASHADQIISSKKGRARQMNAGAAVASGEILLFLHADSFLPGNFLYHLQKFYVLDKAWGRFDVRIENEKRMFRIIEAMMNLRSRMTGICTGDQAIFMKRSVFNRVGGFALIPLMEDIEISKRLRKISKPFCINNPTLTSARRWLKGGILPTILLMWWLRLAYHFGVSPEHLAKHYYK